MSAESSPSDPLESDHEDSMDLLSLEQKVREVFGLDEDEEFLEGTIPMEAIFKEKKLTSCMYVCVCVEYSCWLARGALLKGYIYLTTQNLCFFSYIPGEEVR